MAHPSRGLPHQYRPLGHDFHQRHNSSATRRCRIPHLPVGTLAAQSSKMTDRALPAYRPVGLVLLTTAVTSLSGASTACGSHNSGTPLRPGPPVAGAGRSAAAGQSGSPENGSGTGGIALGRAGASVGAGVGGNPAGQAASEAGGTLPCPAGSQLKATHANAGVGRHGTVFSTTLYQPNQNGTLTPVPLEVCGGAFFNSSPQLTLP